MRKATKKQIKNIKDLMRDREARDRSGLFTAEGLKIIRDILARDIRVEAVFMSPASRDKKDNRLIVEHLVRENIPVYRIDRAEYRKVSALKNPEGILALLRKPVIDKKGILECEKGTIVLCDGIQDPGNLGGILRNSAAFGVIAVLLTGDSVDVYNPKVVRSSSGLILDMPVIKVAYHEIDLFKKKGYKLMASHAGPLPDGDAGFFEKVSEKTVVVFGNEGNGISDEVLSRADKMFHIPITDKVESLNVNSAVAITLYQLSRHDPGFPIRGTGRPGTPVN